MAKDDDTAPDPPADTTPAGPTVAELAERQDKLDGKLDQVLDIIKGGERTAQGKAQEHEERKLDAPTSVAEEIRAQLEEKERRDKAAAEADDHKNWRTKVDQALEGMKEQAPEPPRRRVEKLMGWH